MYIQRARFAAITLLAANFVLGAIVCIVAAKVFCQYAIGDPSPDYGTPSPDYNGTSDDIQDYTAWEIIIVFYSLPAGMVFMAAITTGIHHIRVWNLATAAAAQTTAWISWYLILLAMLFATRDEFNFGDFHLQRIKVLCICLFVLTATHLVYCLALYIPDESLRANLDRTNLDC